MFIAKATSQSIYKTYCKKYHLVANEHDTKPLCWSPVVENPELEEKDRVPITELKDIPDFTDHTQCSACWQQLADVMEDALTTMKSINKKYSHVRNPGDGRPLFRGQ